MSWTKLEHCSQIQWCAAGRVHVGGGFLNGNSDPINCMFLNANFAILFPHLSGNNCGLVSGLLNWRLHALLEFCYQARIVGLKALISHNALAK